MSIAIFGDRGSDALETREITRERGAALLLVIFSLFVLCAFSSSLLWLSIGELRVDQKFVRFQQASAAADAGAYAPLISWDIIRYNGLDVGGSYSFSGEIADGTGAYSGAITRLGPRLFLVTAEGTSADSQVQQRAGAIMRLRPLAIAPRAALDYVGPMDIEETVRISGSDRPPYGWNCMAYATGDLPAIRCPTQDSGTAPWSGCDESTCLEGDPLWEAAPDSVSPGSLDLGGATLSDLRAVAVHVLEGGTVRPGAVETNGICVTAVQHNWGDPYEPWGACGDHFPAIYSVGGLQVHGGHGQGILVVDGDLTVSGGFHYYGIVIVLGKLLSLGVGSQITGAVFVANGDFLPQTLGGMTRIQYSSCAVRRALAGSGRGVLLRERSWLDMY